MHSVSRPPARLPTLIRLKPGPVREAPKFDFLCQWFGAAGAASGRRRDGGIWGVQTVHLFPSDNGPFFPRRHRGWCMLPRPAPPPEPGPCPRAEPPSGSSSTDVKAERRLPGQTPSLRRNPGPGSPSGRSPWGSAPGHPTPLGHAGLSGREVAPLDKEGSLPRESGAGGPRNRLEELQCVLSFPALSGGHGEGGTGGWAGLAGRPSHRPVAAARPPDLRRHHVQKTGARPAP